MQLKHLRVRTKNTSINFSHAD